MRKHILFPMICLISFVAANAIALELADMQRLIPGKMALGRDMPDKKRFKIYFGLDKTATKISDEQVPKTGKWKLIVNGQLCIKWDNEKDFHCVFLVPMQTGTFQVYSRNNKLVAIFDHIKLGKAPKPAD